MTREEALERAIAQETETQNKLRGEIAELRAENDALKAAAKPAAPVSPAAAVAEKAPAHHKPASPAK